MIAAHQLALSPFERLLTHYWARAVVATEPHATIASVAALMDVRRVSCIPVTDRDGWAW